MIGFVEGKVEYSGKDYLCINVNGVGYVVSVNTSTIAEFADYSEDVRLYTYTNFSQDSISLIGFSKIEELEIFKNLISVSGVGPKAGLAILDALTVDEINLAIASGDSKTISKAKGVGVKAAEKIIIELKDKITIADCLESNTKKNVKASGISSSSEAETVAALVSLGYSQSDAFKAVRKVDNRENMSTEELLSATLSII